MHRRCRHQWWRFLVWQGPALPLSLSAFLLSLSLSAALSSLSLSAALSSLSLSVSLSRHPWLPPLSQTQSSLSLSL
uniref:Uncharacterized protein n=1 Tax=Fagus sylvatica TaxID=28930 RepID=A0A2N9GT18_FAGSY